MSKELIGSLVRDRKRIQKQRIAWSNRAAAVKRGAASGGLRPGLSERMAEQFRAMEEFLEGELAQLIRETRDAEPIVQILEDQYGVGPILVSTVLAYVDIHKAHHVSALWRFCGFGVVDGKRERAVASKTVDGKRTEAEPRHFCGPLKAQLRRLGELLLKSGSPYREDYDVARAYYEANRPDWSKGHIHNAALGKMLKLWLSHLWETWRALEGLAVQDPWIIGREDDQGHRHAHKIMAADRGWPALVPYRGEAVIPAQASPREPVRERDP